MFHLKGKYVRFRKRNIFFRFFLGVLLVATVAVSFLAIITFHWFQRNMMQDIESMKKQELLIAGNIFEEYIARCENFAMTLYQNTNLKTVMLSDNGKLEWLGSYSNAVSQVQNIMAVNSFINSIYIINPTDISFFVSNYTETEEAQLLLMDHIQNNSKLHSPFVWNAETINGRTIPTLTVYFCEKIAENGLHRGAIAINMDLTILEDTMFNGDFDTNQQIMIVEKAGNTVLSSPSGSDFTERAYAERILHSANSEDGFTTSVNGTDMFISYTSICDGDFFIISEMESASSMHSLIESRNQLLLICSYTMIIIIGASFAVSRFAYKPISQVYNNIRTLFHIAEPEEEASNELHIMTKTLSIVAAQMQSLEKKNMHHTIVKLLRSEDMVSSSTTEECLVRFGILPHIEAPFMLALLHIDNYPVFMEKHSSETIAFQLSSLCALASECFQSVAHCSAWQTEDDIIVLILSNKSLPPLSVTGAAKRLQHAALSSLGAEITISFSEVNTKAERIGCMYQHALSKSKTRILFAPGHLFPVSEVTSPLNASVADKEEKNLLQAAKSLPTEDFLAQFESFLLLFQGCGYDQILKILAQLAISMSQITDKITPGTEQDRGYISVYETLSKMQNHNELLEWFRHLHMEMNSAITDAGNKKAHDIVISSFSIITEDYSDTQLSVNSIAERLSISAGYYSRIFNEITGYSFPDYINNLRLEKASSLLLAERNLTIRDIALRVGYSSESYFSSSFKKKYGISPSKYRLNYQ